MKKLLESMLALSVLAFAGPSFSQEAWLLSYQDDHYVVARTTEGRFQNVTHLGHRPSYGESRSEFGFLSRKLTSNSFVLDLIEKTSGRTTRSLPVSGEVLAQLSGPSKDVMIANNAVYFITVRFIGTNGIEPNDKGGTFDFNYVDLSDGDIHTLSLPKEFGNPRLFDYKGTPIVYTWNGYRVWMFDTHKKSLKEIVSTDDVVNTLLDEREGERDGRVAMGSFADYVFLPTVGVFRLSKLGDIHQILNDDLVAINDQNRSIHVGDARDIKILPAIYENEPAIGVLKKANDQWSFAYMDPRSLEMKEQVTLSKGALPNSIFPAGENAVFYVDQETGTINKASRGGVEMVWKLNGGRDRNLGDVRILQIVNK